VFSDATAADAEGRTAHGTASALAQFSRTAGTRAVLETAVTAIAGQVV
jgi:hypothetical protein